MDRIRDKVQCNPTVKLTKGEIYPFVGIDRITSGNRDIAIADKEVYSGQSCSKFRKGDTIMARITPCLENGKIAQYNLDSEIAMGSTELFVFREMENISDNDYIYYLISTDYVRNNAVNSMTGASGRQRADIKFIGKLKWDFPEYDVQCKIGKILSTYDDLIEKNSRKIEILQEMAEELYKEWFVRFRFPGYKTAKFTDGIPDGWEVDRVESLGIFTRGKNITASEMISGNIPVISAGIEPSGYHNEANVQGVSITISSSGANAGYMRINYSDVWAADCLYVNNIENIFYLYELLNNIRPCIDNLQRGAAQPHVYAKDVNRLKIVLPAEEIRTNFNDFVKNMHLSIASLTKQNENLKIQRDLLLPRLMSGKLAVKVS